MPSSDSRCALAARVERVLLVLDPAARADVRPAGVALRHDVRHAGRLRRRDQVVEALGAEPVGGRERPVEVLRVEPAGQRRHLVYDGVRLAVATASPTAALSSPSTTTACAPRCSSRPGSPASLVVAVTRWPPLDELPDQPRPDGARATGDVDVHRSHPRLDCLSDPSRDSSRNVTAEDSSSTRGTALGQTERVLLTVSTTHRPATDLGYLLHKHPDRVQEFPQSFGGGGRSSTPRRRRAVHGGARARRRPGPARPGRGARSSRLQPGAVRQRPLLRRVVPARRGHGRRLRYGAQGPLPVAAGAGRLGDPARDRGLRAPCRGGPRSHTGVRAARVRRWRRSRSRSTTRSRSGARPATSGSDYRDGPVGRRSQPAACRCCPCLDESKHYWQGPDEVDKLLRSGKGWLADHPDRDLITRRYLGRMRAPPPGSRSTRLAELGDEVEDAVEPAEDEEALQPEARRDPAQRPAARGGATRRSCELEATSVPRPGCGAGHFLERLVGEPCVHADRGQPTSRPGPSQHAARRLGVERMTRRQADRGRCCSRAP